MNEADETAILQPFPKEREAARQSPNGYVYRIAAGLDPDDGIPPEAISGAWKVDEKGEIVGEFIANSGFKQLFDPAAENNGT